MSLSCYTLTEDDVKPGIRVASFESIITSDPSTTTVELARMRTIPIVSTTTTGQKAPDASLCLIFLEEVAKSTKTSSKGLLLALDPSLWCLYSKDTKIVLIDPCSPSRQVLVFIPASGDISLISTSTDGLSFSVTRAGKPVVNKYNRANLLAGSLNLPLTAQLKSKTLVESPVATHKDDSPTTSKKHKGNPPRSLPAKRK